MHGFTEHIRHLQVNRVFQGATLISPLIQHKIDLFSAGLEYNATVGVDLADSRKALLQYRSSLDSLRPTDKRVVDDLPFSHIEATGGVYAAVGDSVLLFTLGSTSRGIPYKEWEIPLPVDSFKEWGFYPGADVIFFIEGR
jgi:hypothetical protein